MNRSDGGGVGCSGSSGGYGYCRCCMVSRRWWTVDIGGGVAVAVALRLGEGVSVGLGVVWVWVWVWVCV